MEQTIREVISRLYNVDVAVILTRPEPQFGDFSTNVAMQLAKRVGKNPREIALEIIETLQMSDEIAQAEVAGPGFINIRLTDAALLQLVEKQPTTQLSGQHYVVEYSCPNAFKELHTGHLYQTVVGDIVARLVERAGAVTHRTSFGGDVGLHVAKCLWGMVAELGGEYPEKLTDVGDSAFVRAQWISACYVRGAAAYEANETTKQEIDDLNKAIYGFHDNDERNLPLAELYWTTRQWSFDYFEAFYDKLRVDQMRYIPESETAPIGMSVVKDQLEKGNLKQSDGAVVFEGDESKHLHTRVFVTSKGLPTYETKDIGVIWLEKNDYQFSHRILLTGNDQKEYMRVVFAAADTFQPGLADAMTHLTNGTVRFADGSKMSSRLGNVARAIDVFDAVREKVAELVDDEALIEPVTLGAIKYVFAKYRLGGDIAFDINETVSLQGNSGPYLQYAHARACSIIKKASQEPVREYTYKLNESERLLVQRMTEFNEIVKKATTELAPHHICNYLFDLSQEFNRFYEKNRVVGTNQEPARVRLVSDYIGILRTGLDLLGIEAPEKM